MDGGKSCDFLCGPIAAPPCTLPKEHSKTRTQDSLWRGGMLAFFFLDLLQHLHVLCQTRASKDKDTLQPWGGNARDFFLDYFSS